ncbi:MAG TPA: hypothetical protein DCE52_13935 [Rhodobacteraceae bacterium]|nr:hypothetical protein [Paracoccaceae bacterium]
MSDVNQELVHALKLLSKQYEQQFSEVALQIAELGEQIILLTNTPSSSLSNTNSSSSEGLMKSVEASACKDCDNALFFAIDKTSSASFDCLISSAVTNPVFDCSKKTVSVKE